MNRVFALSLLFTPSLGLFNTLHHGRMAALLVSNERTGDAFDYAGNQKISLQEAWNQFKIDDSSEFADIPALAVLAMMFTMLIFHLFASACILKVIFKSQNISVLALDGFYTIISPPLHYDWEFFSLTNKGEDGVVKCWKR